MQQVVPVYRFVQFYGRAGATVGGGELCRGFVGRRYQCMLAAVGSWVLQAHLRALQVFPELLLFLAGLCGD